MPSFCPVVLLHLITYCSHNLHLWCPILWQLNLSKWCLGVDLRRNPGCLFREDGHNGYSWNPSAWSAYCWALDAQPAITPSTHILFLWHHYSNHTGFDPIHVPLRQFIAKTSYLTTLVGRPSPFSIETIPCWLTSVLLSIEWGTFHVHAVVPLSSSGLIMTAHSPLRHSLAKRIANHSPLPTVR